MTVVNGTLQEAREILRSELLGLAIHYGADMVWAAATYAGDTEADKSVQNVQNAMNGLMLF
jgi:hypothetical protein